MKARTRGPDTGDLWRLTMEHSPVGMALVSLTGDFLTANNALCDMMGYDLEAMTSMSFHDITHPDDLAIDLRLVAQALAGTISSYRISKRYIRADGTVLVGDLSVALLRDDSGTPMHFVSQIADLSERRAFEARLESAEEQIDVERRRAEAVFESVAVGLLLIDASGDYLAYNSRHQHLLDLAFPSGHRGHAGQDGAVLDADLTHRLTRGEMPTVRAASGEEFENLLVWVGDDPLTRRALSVSSRSVWDRGGNFAGAALAYHDVTELMRAIQVKDEFIGSVSHELRTPLTSALAYLELLDGAQHLEPAVRTQVAAVRRNMLRLSHLVADLLLTAAATSGAPVIDPYEVDLALIIGEAAYAARIAAEGAGVDLEVELPESLVTVVDGTKLRQVADNLIANAIAYTSPGGWVRVSLSVTDGFVELVVVDCGEGIEESDLGEIFSKFVRGQNARRRLVPGTGLGLTIVRSIVEAHGGEVTLDSTVGVGTTVRMILPS